ncbi:hypothetical protein AWENTII_003137 [Aspergillus wentii]
MAGDRAQNNTAARAEARLGIEFSARASIGMPIFPALSTGGPLVDGHALRSRRFVCCFPLHDRWLIADSRAALFSDARRDTAAGHSTSVWSFCGGEVYRQIQLATQRRDRRQ